MKSPVLFLIFNRIDVTLIVLNQIKEYQPEKLYIAADGPRESIVNENITCKQLRENVLKEINWPCEVFTLFRDKNLGCKEAVSSAITWFFENEPFGIILEDDCLPNQTFFNFCNELLQKYENNKKIWHISGNNFQNGIKRGESDYYFSMFNHIWGWATWRDRWQKYNSNINLYNISEDLIYYSNDQLLKKYFLYRQKQVSKKQNTWDYQWLFCMWQNKGYAILPQQNLVSNIGFNSILASNTTKKSKISNLKTKDLDIEIHPHNIILDSKADKFTFKEIYYKEMGIINKLKIFVNV